MRPSLEEDLMYKASSVVLVSRTKVFRKLFIAESRTSLNLFSQLNSDLSQSSFLVWTTVHPCGSLRNEVARLGSSTSQEPQESVVLARVRQQLMETEAQQLMETADHTWNTCHFRSLNSLKRGCRALKLQGPSSGLSTSLSAQAALAALEQEGLQEPNEPVEARAFAEAEWCDG